MQKGVSYFHLFSDKTTWSISDISIVGCQHLIFLSQLFSAAGVQFHSDPDNGLELLSGYLPLAGELLHDQIQSFDANITL